MATIWPYLENTLHKYHTSKFNSANLTWLAPGEHIFRLTRLSWLHLGAPYLLLRLLELACSLEFITGSLSNFTKSKFFKNISFKGKFLQGIFFKCASALFWLQPTSLKCLSGGDCCHQDFISNSPVCQSTTTQPKRCICVFVFVYLCICVCSSGEGELPSRFHLKQSSP